MKMIVGINRAKKLSRPARNINLVTTAIQRLGNGITMSKIVKYLSEVCVVPTPKREIVAALKRGVEFGLMDRNRGRYSFAVDEKREKNSRKRQPADSGRITVKSVKAVERTLKRNKKIKKSSSNRQNKSKVVSKLRGKVTLGIKNSKKPKGQHKSLKKTRFSKSVRTYETPLSDYYKNPTYRPSVVSSIDSLEYYARQKSSTDPNYIN